MFPKIAEITSANCNLQTTAVAAHTYWYMIEQGQPTAQRHG